MSLEQHIARIGRTVKSRLLGSRVTELLRFTFSNSANSILKNETLNKAVLLKEGYNLVSTSKHRELLIDHLTTSEISALGYSNHQDAKESLAQNAKEFCEALSIDPTYIKTATPEERVESFMSSSVYGEALKSKGNLHPYQLQLKQELLHDIKNVAYRSHLCTMPTGAGKTTLAHETIIDLIRNAPLKEPFHFLWIVEEQILAEQSLRSFDALWKIKGHSRLKINRFFGEFEGTQLDSEFPTATFATFTLGAVRLQDEKFTELLSKIDLMVIDEAHSSKAETYEQVIQVFRRLNRSGQILGLTATPYRPDDDEFDSITRLFENRREITDSYGNNLPSPIDYLIQHRYLSKVEFYELNMNRAYSEESEYYKDLHDNIVLACSQLQKENSNCIIFAESMPHAVALQLLLEYSGFQAGLIIGDTPPSKREQLLQSFAADESDLNILINHEILSKGLDVPRLNSIMILGKVGNPAQALQILGRAMRGPLNGGNENNKIYLTKDNFNRISNFGLLEKTTLNHE